MKNGYLLHLGAGKSHDRLFRFVRCAAFSFQNPNAAFLTSDYENMGNIITIIRYGRNAEPTAPVSVRYISHERLHEYRSHGSKTQSLF